MPELAFAAAFCAWRMFTMSLEMDQKIANSILTQLRIAVDGIPVQTFAVAGPVAPEAVVRMIHDSRDLAYQGYIFTGLAVTVGFLI